MAPIIGITCKTTEDDMENYINAIETYGAEAHLFASLDGVIPKYPATIDGLLLPGGGDIDPCRFNELRHHVREISMIKGVSKSRDTLEIRLCQKALEADIPVFGICRGIQIMSVAMDGNLFQDIPSQLSDHLPHKVEHGDSQHDIQIQPGSLLNQITCDRTAKVNSRHHQALKVIGEGFTVTAQSKDGIIEAIENKSKQFVLGVQYHPERMIKDPKLKKHGCKLFKAFIKAASQRCRQLTI